MTQDRPSLPINQPRRSDRAVTAEMWIKTFLHCAPFGVLATVNDGQPFINMNLFVYDEAAHAIYLHTAIEGRARRNIEAEERVCFSVGEMGRVLPADTAISFSIEYASVMVFGRAGIVEDVDQARRAMQLLLDKYAPHLCPGQDYHPITDEEIRRTGVFRIQIDSWSGKKNEALADYPRAYHYVEQPMLPSNYWKDLSMLESSR
ncbi:MAG: pyridoxamine 5'-phosphate oxidase family protein [Anaerolineae bacterium]|nr:pyridoxamine 5'-phosphate oxidase family protein [Anaerolineae bacterium]